MFSVLIGLYENVDEFLPIQVLKDFDGDTIVEKLAWDWDIFNYDDTQDVESFLIAALGQPHPKYDSGIDTKSWVEHRAGYWCKAGEPSERLIRKWKIFCNELIHDNRFFPLSRPNLELLSKFQLLTKEVKKGKCYYRARRTELRKKIAPKNMGHPPKNMSKAGRANPKGISYLYLASDKETAIHEIQGQINKYVTIGKFKTSMNLSIFDLINPRIEDPFALGDDLPFVLEHLLFFKMLGHQLSKPISPKDKDLLYVPSQYLCEFIKNQGYDGIAYKSSAGEGYNIALFQSPKIKCTRSYLYEIGIKVMPVSG